VGPALVSLISSLQDTKPSRGLPLAGLIFTVALIGASLAQIIVFVGLTMHQLYIDNVSQAKVLESALSIW
jgi:hypothetical protein